MATTIRLTNGPTLEMRVDQIEVASFSPRPDPNWSGVDTHWHVTDEWIDADGDERSEGEYRCDICAEVIHPGTVGPSPFREFIPGERHYYIDDREVGPDEFKTAWTAAASVS